MRIPIAADIYAWPAGDTVITLTPTANPASSGASASIRLHQLDPQATTYKSAIAESSDGEFHFATINQNNYLLLPYRRKVMGPADPEFRLVLARVTKNNFGYLQVQPRVLDFPANSFSSLSYISQITAIDDYFLIGHYQDGIYKVKQDGSIRRVSSQARVTSTYKWQGKIYANASQGILLVSADDGETWTTYTGAPSYLYSSGFRVLGDSLVGYVRPFNQLYSLRWNGGTGKIRELKNDGMGQATISCIEQLNDTVYVGTTNGLFKRPLNKFFESKSQ